MTQRFFLSDKFDIESQNDPDTFKMDKRMRQMHKNNKQLEDAISIGHAADNTAKDIKLGLHSNSEKLRRVQDNTHRISTVLD